MDTMVPMKAGESPTSPRSMALHTLATEAGQRHEAARTVQAFVTGNAARREYLAAKVYAFIRFMFASRYMHHIMKVAEWLCCTTGGRMQDSGQTAWDAAEAAAGCGRAACDALR